MSQLNIFNDTFLSMGALCDVVLPNVDADKAREVFQKVKTEVEQLEERLNRFLPESAVSQLCASPINEWVSVADDLWEALSISYDFYQMSNGAFDITFGPLVSLWEQKENPTTEEIAEVKTICGYNHVEFNFEEQKIRFLREGIEFDFDGMQKGLALDHIKPLLEDMGIADAIVSFDEDAVLALGNHPNGKEWPIGIRNQKRPMEFVHGFAASDQIISSFGTMEKVGMEDEIAKSYTISPETGEAIRDKRTVSVKSTSGLVGAFIATCWLILPENDREILSENFKDIEVFEATYLADDIKTKHSIINENNPE